MPKLRATTTDRLADVIEVIELGQRTGLLSVERGSSAVVEEGHVYFVNGRAIFAALDGPRGRETLARLGLRGREALAHLVRWGTCHFAFDTTAARPQPNIFPERSTPSSPPDGSTTPTPTWPSPSPAHGGPVVPGVPGAPGGSSPGQRQPYHGTTQGTIQGPVRSSPTLRSEPGQRDHEGVTPGWPQRGPQTTGGEWYEPGQSERLSSPGLNGQRWPAQGGGALVPPGVPTQPGGSGAPGPQGSHALLRRPRRSPDASNLMALVAAYNLSRAHRTLLLLADGEHTVADLARLSSKPFDETLRLLAHLETAGLVYYADG